MMKKKETLLVVFCPSFDWTVCFPDIELPIYNGILLSHKKNKFEVDCSSEGMDLEPVIQSEVSQKEKDRVY